MNKYMCEPVIPGECVIKIAIDKQILSSARHHSSDKQVSDNTNKQLTPLKCSVELFVGSDKKFEFKIDTKKPLSGKAKVKSIVDKCQQTMAVISFQKPKRGLREELEKGIKVGLTDLSNFKNVYEIYSPNRSMTSIQVVICL